MNTETLSQARTPGLYHFTETRLGFLFTKWYNTAMSPTFDEYHAEYAKQDWIHKPSLFAEWAIQHFPTNGSLLDLGGGQGQDALYFAEKGYAVTLLDFTESALDRAREKFLNNSVNVRVVHHDMYQPLPFYAEDFDVVYAHLSLHYFGSDKTFELFNEIHTLLKPGGILALIVNSTSDPEYGTGEQIEPDYFLIDGLHKRFFSIESIRTYVTRFQTIVLDAQGETYKDRATGVHNLIRFIGKK